MKGEGQPDLHESSDEELASHGDSDDEGREEQARLRVEMCRMQQGILERLRIRPKDLRIVDPARHSTTQPPLPDRHPHTRKESREALKSRSVLLMGWIHVQSGELRSQCWVLLVILLYSVGCEEVEMPPLRVVGDDALSSFSCCVDSCNCKMNKKKKKKRRTRRNKQNTKAEKEEE